MHLTRYARAATLAAVLPLTSCAVPLIQAQQTAPPAAAPVSRVEPPAEGNYRLDLPTALALAGARDLDLLIAQEKLVEAEANHQMACQKFLPWLSPGFTYRSHGGNIQAVEGTVFDASKQSYTAGASLTAAVDPGAAYFESLAARRREDAASSRLETERLAALLNAALAYYDLAREQALVKVAQESIRLSAQHESQLTEASEAGLAFKGDVLRVKAQTERTRLALRQAQESRRLAEVRLIECLRLSPSITLTAADERLAPINLISSAQDPVTLAQEAVRNRPEMVESEALAQAAGRELDGAKLGPLFPAIGAQVFGGGLGGGVGDNLGTFGGTNDYQVTLGWRVGPGGLLDRARIKASESRVNTARLEKEKIKDAIIRQVAEAQARTQSLREQIQTAQDVLAAAEETHQLTADRKEFGVGAILENIVSQQDLTEARRNYLTILADYNRSQFQLNAALGNPAPAKQD